MRRMSNRIIAYPQPGMNEAMPAVGTARLLGLVSLAVLLFLVLSTTAQSQSTFDRMLLHSNSVTTDSVVRRLVSQRAVILDTSSYFRIVTIRVDSASETAIRSNSWVIAIEPLPVLETSNDKSRAAIGVDRVQPAPYTSVANAYNLAGQGVLIGIWDAMFPAAHGDFSSRLTIVENQTCPGQDHATHVAGTVAGTGISGTPQYLYAGMAPMARIFGWSMYGPSCGSGPSYPFQEALSGVSTQGIVISQNSWGFSLLTSATCALHGSYPIYCNAYDRLVREENLSVFFAAGNQRGYAVQMALCGLSSGFGTLPPPGTAKNVVTIGATDGLGDMTTFSSWGPTRDGRLKPDCVADGFQIRSAQSTSGYQPLNGTSMACPAASGSGALLIERYRQLYSTTPRPDLLKNLMLNNCVDRGNPGPDYKYGYGLLDIPASLKMIDDDQIWNGTIDAAHDTARYELVIPEVGPSTRCPIKIMLVYSDVPGNPNASASLVNDLDLALVDPAGTVTLPLTLEPSTPNANALPAENHRDNVEQVILQNPLPGIYRIRVIGNAIDPNEGVQNFSVTWTETNLDCNVAESDCIDFEDEDISGWYLFEALKGIHVEGGNYGKVLKLTDQSSAMGSPGSMAINNDDFAGNWIELADNGCLCFDYKVNWDGNSDPVRAAKIRIYTGPAIPSNCQTCYPTAKQAVFVGNAGNPPVQDNVWQSFCLPVGMCSGGQLPSNSFGHWEVRENGVQLTGQAACDAWDDIITDVTGVMLTTEYNNGIEEISFDNFCWSCVESPCSEVTSQEISCRVDEKGEVVYDYCVTVTNTSPYPAYASTAWGSGPSGVTVATNPNYLDFFPPNIPIPPGGTWTHCFVISGPGALPGTMIRFDDTISLFNAGAPSAAEKCVKCEITDSIALPECPLPQDCCPTDFTHGFTKTKLTLPNNGIGYVDGFLTAGPLDMQSVKVTLVASYIRGVPTVGEITGGSLGGSLGTVSPMHEITFGQWAPCEDLTTPTNFKIDLKLPPHSCPPPSPLPQLITCPERDSVCLRFQYVDCECRTCDTIICYAVTRKKSIILGGSDKIAVRKRLDFVRRGINDEKIPGTSAAEPESKIQGELRDGDSALLSIVFPQPLESSSAIIYVGVTIETVDSTIYINGAANDRGDFFIAAAGNAYGSFEANPDDSMSISLNYNDIDGIDAVDHIVTIAYLIDGETFEEEFPITFYRKGEVGGDVIVKEGTEPVAGTRTIALHLQNLNNAERPIDFLALTASPGVAILAVGPTADSTTALLDLGRVDERDFVGEIVEGLRVRLMPGESMTPIYVTLRGGDAASTITFTTLDIDGNAITQGELQIPSSVLEGDDDATAGGIAMESYPNPANGTSTIELYMPRSARDVELSIVDAAGRVVRELLTEESLHNGTHLFVVDTSTLPSGTYFYVVTTELGTVSRSVRIIR